MTASTKLPDMLVNHFKSEFSSPQLSWSSWCCIMQRGPVSVQPFQSCRFKSKINDYYCFKPLGFGMVCHTAIDGWYIPFVTSVSQNFHLFEYSGMYKITSRTLINQCLVQIYNRNKSSKKNMPLSVQMLVEWCSSWASKQRLMEKSLVKLTDVGDKWANHSPLEYMYHDWWWLFAKLSEDDCQLWMSPQSTMKTSPSFILCKVMFLTVALRCQLTTMSLQWSRDSNALKNGIVLCIK